MKGFRFNQTFDESLFSFEVPNGYKAMHTPSAPALLSGEESIIEALCGIHQDGRWKVSQEPCRLGEWAVFLSQSGMSQEETSATIQGWGP